MWSIFVAYDYNMKTLKLINSIEMHHQIQFVGAATDWIQLNPESPIFSQNPVDLVFGIPNEFEISRLQNNFRDSSISGLHLRYRKNFEHYVMVTSS